MARQERNSAFELIRIIAMLFIVIGHISVHAQNRELASHNYITAFAITGVNLFVLISGYFGIKLNWRNLLTLIGTVAFYNLASIVCKWQITGTTPMLGEIAGCFSPFCNSHWWFINCYFALMLLSPVINITLEKSTTKQYKYFLGILLLMSCISGFYFKNLINLNGYNTFQFITIYVLGDAIRRFNLTTKYSTKQYISVYILSTLCLFISSFFMQRTMLYNNPLVVISALSLFCMIAKLHFKSKAINYIATFMLPVYLLQDSSTGQLIYKYLYQSGIKMNFQGIEYTGLIGIYVVALLGSAFILDNTRRVLLARPTNTLSRKLTDKLDLFNL